MLKTSRSCVVALCFWRDSARSSGGLGGDESFYTPISIGDIFAGHLECYQPGCRMGMPVLLRSREPKPFVSLDPRFSRVLRRPLQTGMMMSDAQCVLRRRIAQMCGAINPHHGPRLVCRRSLASSVHDPEVELSQSMPLLGCFEVPAGRLRVVGHASFSSGKF